MIFNPDNPKEHYHEPAMVIKLYNGKLATKEEIMTFNLEGYKPEAPAEGGFEPFKYEGAVKVGYARIVPSEQASEFYKTPAGTPIFELEVTVASGDFEGRKLWRRFNLGSQVKEGKKEKTQVQKLADQLFPLGLEFTNQEQLSACCEKLVTMTPSIKAYKAKINGEEKQVWNIKGIAGAEEIASGGQSAF